jgi:two-component system sensor histidine kinase KdpD
MLAATRYGLRTGIVTSLACSLAYNFFFIPPLNTFTIQDPQNIITVLVLLGVAIVGSQLAARVRAQAVLAQASAAQNRRWRASRRGLPASLHRRTGAGAVRRDRAAPARQHGAADAGGGGPCGARVRAAGGRLAMLDDAAARWAFDNNKPAGQGSDTLTASEWLFYPIGTTGRVLAVFGLSRPDAGAPVRADQLPFLLSLLDQAGLALERIALAEEMADLAHVRERDRLRHALLSSVSHDLRTPLTTILGSLAEIRRCRPNRRTSSPKRAPKRSGSTASSPTCWTWCGSRRGRCTARSNRSIWPKRSPARCTIWARRCTGIR